MVQCGRTQRGRGTRRRQLLSPCSTAIHGELPCPASIPLERDLDRPLCCTAVSLMQHMETTLAQDVGWLLANARQYSGVDGVATAAGFARAGAFEPVHRSAVVRWEHGQVPITHDIVRRYETVLGLPSGRLLSA